MRFLSDEWVNALASSLETPEDGVHLTITYLVTGSDDAFWLRFEPGQVTGGTGNAEEPDLVFACDHETVLALSRNEMPPQAAFMQDRLAITGNLAKLTEHSRLISTLGPAMAELGADG